MDATAKAKQTTQGVSQDSSNSSNLQMRLSSDEQSSYPSFVTLGKKKSKSAKSG